MQSAFKAQVPLPRINQADRDGLRNALIPNTVLHAFEKSSFYHSLYTKAAIPVDQILQVGDLAKLPIVSKAQLRQAGTAALCWDEQTISHVQHTTGSTGEPFLLYRSVEESLFIRDFFTQLHQAQPPADGPVPIMLQLIVPHHGSPTPIPGHAFVLQISMTDNEIMDTLLLLLRKRFEIPGVAERVTILSGGYLGMLALTNYLLEQGIACDQEYQVGLLHVTGGYLTPRWRQVLQETWGATVIDRYSLSEVFGGAGYCHRCQGYHFDPHVVPELIDFNGRPILKSGIGTLLLTPLYPFVQLQPLIRYQTQDLFALDADACYAPQFKLLGRRSHALFHPLDPGHLLLTGNDVLDALDIFPEVNRASHFLDVTRTYYPQAPGQPLVRGLYAQSGGKIQLTLQVELLMTPALFPQRMQEMRTSIENNLLSRSQNLRTLVESGQGQLTIEFVRPHTLGRLAKGTHLWQPMAG